MLSLTEIILVVLSILSWSYTEAQIITVPCDWVCYGSEPPGSGTPISCPAGLQTTIQQNAATPELCICVGSNQIQCMVCGAGVVAGTAQSVCSGGSGAPPTQCLPLIRGRVGTVSSDGHDDVCVLTSCCTGSGTQTVEIPDGTNIACSNVNCTNVCQLSQMRTSLGGEACNQVCTPPATLQQQPPVQNLNSDCVKSCEDSIWAKVGAKGAEALCESILEAGNKAAAVERCEPKAAIACAPLEEIAAIPELAEPVVAFLVALCQVAYLRECVAATTPVADVDEIKTLCEQVADGTVKTSCWL
ncbi:hypothetical protein V8E54_006972 [Elaphomyces granulatus]